MIVSASVRTDIPAFYGAWFLNRLKAGFCLARNPFRLAQVRRIPLDRQSVDGFVFWTKNVGPFLPVLEEVAAAGYPFTVQHTVNAYPRVLEHRVVEASVAVAQVRGLADRFGPRRVVWRYDTIVQTSLTDDGFHGDNFLRLATALQGAVDEVVVSFAQIYAKTRRNLDAAALRAGFRWSDPLAEQKKALLASLSDIAAARGMRLTLCGQPELLVSGVDPSHCVDARRLSDIAGEPIRAAVHGNRPGCACHRAVDIGAYDTCPHGCVYCYAVRNRDLALTRFRRHDPQGPFLFDEPIASGDDPQPRLPGLDGPTDD